MKQANTGGILGENSLWVVEQSFSTHHGDSENAWKLRSLWKEMTYVDH